MTVLELIEKLKEFPSDMPVVAVASGEYWPADVTYVGQERVTRYGNSYKTTAGDSPETIEVVEISS